MFCSLSYGLQIFSVQKLSKNGIAIVYKLAFFSIVIIMFNDIDIAIAELGPAKMAGT